MELFNRVDSTQNNLKNMVSGTLAAGNGGGSTGDAFASTLRASMAASQTADASAKPAAQAPAAEVPTETLIMTSTSAAPLTVSPQMMTQMINAAAQAADGQTDDADETVDALTETLQSAESGSQLPDSTTIGPNDENYVIAPDGVTVLERHHWDKDTTDYVEVLRNADSGRAFVEFAQRRVLQAEAQGIDISGNGSQPSTTEIFDEWYRNHSAPVLMDFVVNAQEGQGYYGMDSDGHWGYYLDPEMTQKHPNGHWNNIKASDGGRALFDRTNGYLWPANVQDMSRAGKTVTLAIEAKAFEVTYNEKGYVERVVNLTSTRGISGYDLDLPMAKSMDDRGLNDPDLLRASNGVSYTGPGSGIAPEDIKPTGFRDWETVMKMRGYIPDSEAETVRTESVQAEAAQPETAAAQPVSTAAEANHDNNTAARGGEYAPETDEAVQSLLDALDDERSAAAEAAVLAEPSLTPQQVMAAIDAGSLTPEVLSAYEHYFGRSYGT